MKVSDLVESAVYKLRKHVEQIEDVSDEDEDVGDDFENLYKGEISKSGAAILPSKRVRRVPEKINADNLEAKDEEKNEVEPSVDKTDSADSTNETEDKS